jgi:hypothetical protein
LWLFGTYFPILVFVPRKIWQPWFCSVTSMKILEDVFRNFLPSKLSESFHRKCNRS